MDKSKIISDSEHDAGEEQCRNKNDRGENGMTDTSNMRLEADFLGSKWIPATAGYGIQTVRAAENFPITGYRMHGELIRAIALVKKAAATANLETGRLPRELAEPIAAAAQEIADGRWHEQFIVDPIQGGAGTSFNMNTNEVIANLALKRIGKALGDYRAISPNSHVNMSQSTNDVFPTSVHLAVLSLTDRLTGAMKSLLDTLRQKAREFAPVIKMGRTHLQDAVPIRLGQEFEAYSRAVSRDLERIKRALPAFYEINMGATAVGTGVNADPRYAARVTELLAEMSGFPLYTAEHLVDATQNTDAYTTLSGALKICMINMSKIANDLRLMASGPTAGLGEIRLPARQPGSSIMPGKVNPVMCEVINQVAFQVIGNDLTINLASEAGQFELNVMEPVLVFNLLQSISMMDQAFRVFVEFCLAGIEALEERCTAYVEHSVGIVTALNPHIGYELAAELAREALASGRPIRELCLERRILPEEALSRILDPYEMTHPGIAGGELFGALNNGTAQPVTEGI